MKRDLLLATLIFSLFALLQMAAPSSLLAAPGDFLLEWGARQHFINPGELARDQSGNIYVVDRHTDNFVQIFDRTGKRLYRWGSYGSADGQFQFAAGIAVAPGGNIYLTDFGNNRVQFFDVAGNFLGKWGDFGSGDGQFNAPDGIAVDAAGNVYVADSGNNRIQVFDPTGRFLRKWGSAGSGNEQFNTPSALAVDSRGNVYVVDELNYRIQVFDSTGHFLRKWGSYGSGNNQFQAPQGIAIDANGNVLVSDFGNANVQVFDANGTFLRSFGSLGENDGQFNGAAGIVVQTNGEIYVADSNHDRIEIFSATGAYLRKWWSYGSGPGEFKAPQGIALDAGGNVYVADTANNRIQVFTGTGTFLRQWGSYGTGEGQFVEPRAIAIDATGKVYVGEATSTRIQVFDSSGTFLKTTGQGQVYSVGGLALDAAGNLYVANTGYFSVDIFDSAGTLVREFGGYAHPDPNISAPFGIALDPAGNIYIADSGWWRVEVYDNQGNFLRQIGAGVIPAAPYGIAVDANGNVFVSVAQTGEILVFDRTGILRARWGGIGDAPGLFNGPIGLALDKTGSRLYVADSGNNRIQVLEALDEQLPFGWSTRDIGSVGVAGRASFSRGTFTVQGSGADIYGTADGFRFVYQPLSGDGQIVARVVSLQNTNPYAKAGVMIRQALSANSPHAMMVITPGYGAEFSRRTTLGGSTTVTGLGGVAAPYWVKLVRKGSTFTGFVSQDGNSWVQVGSSSITMASAVYIGLAVTSHNNSVLTTATFDGVSLAGQVSIPTVAITSPANGASYSAAASVAISASATAGAGGTVKQVDFYAGSTLIGTATASPYTITWAQVPAGNYLLTARVTDTLGAVVTSDPVTISVVSTALPQPWSSIDVGSVGLAGSASFVNGVFTVKGAGADIYGGTDAFRYVYQSLNGDGQIVARVLSLQNTNGYAKGGVMIRESLSANSRHVAMVLTPVYGAEFSRRSSTAGATAVTGLAGVAAPYWVKLVRKGNTFTGFVSKDAAAWVQVGSTSVTMAASVTVGLVVTSHNTAVLCTSTMDGVSVTGQVAAPTVSITAPANAATFTAPATVTVSADATAGSGAAVKQVDFYAGSTLIGTAFAAPYSITWKNVAVGSYSLTARTTDTLGATATSAPVAITVTLPPPWLTQDVGSVGIDGSADFFNGTFALRGSGADIWGAADAFRMVYRTMTGNGQITARITALQNTDNFAKGGVMIRDSLAAGAKHALIDLKPGGGAEFLWRGTTGGGTSASGLDGLSFPRFLRVVRSGSTFTGYVSANGVDWIQVGSATISMNSTVYVGLVVSSHNNALLGTATFDAVQVGP